ncbi:MAG TPA: exodeoxyribonuclease VII small subunit [Candidatus Dojkabacteria bacterium]|nr:exodeoxyribonuclease VII small subunit [Candidatus Dojkabacteria bacterium]HRO65312.1 exodeoxyribonuclease VII small subunit [Candidatus Dojkabacteria bacterium]HRP51753.1 exodeoxyribonuclease VII small subunit [Candidatus Dojkabacteria bacterium]
MPNKKPTLQEKINKLEKLSNFFTNQDDLDLDEAVKKYEEASKLAVEIKKELTSIELKIKEIKATYEETEESDF